MTTLQSKSHLASTVRLACQLATIVVVLTMLPQQASAAYKYCVDFSPSYLDQDLGEDKLLVPPGGAIPVKHHYYRMWNSAGTQVLMTGYLDSSGCSVTTSAGTGKFEVFSLVRRGVHPNTLVIRTKRVSTSEGLRYVYFPLSLPSSPGASISTIELHIGGLLSDHFRVSAVAMELEASLLVGGQDWTVLVSANTDEQCPGQASACASSSVIWLGQLPDGETSNNQYKSVIAHELGHLAQRAMFGVPSSPSANGAGDYSDSPNDWLFCGCWYVENPNDRLHCLTSREYLAPAFSEAYAHYFATRAFNHAGESDAVFPYYKRVLKPRSQNPSCMPGGSCSFWIPPVAHDVTQAHRWLETQCVGDAVAHRATEMDWLGLLYDLGAKRGYSGADFRSIMTHGAVCGGVCNGNTEMTWAGMSTSVDAQGFSTDKELMFDMQSDVFGVDR